MGPGTRVMRLSLEILASGAVPSEHGRREVAQGLSDELFAASEEFGIDARPSPGCSVARLATRRDEPGDPLTSWKQQQSSSRCKGRGGAAGSGGCRRAERSVSAERGKQQEAAGRAGPAMRGRGIVQRSATGSSATSSAAVQWHRNASTVNEWKISWNPNTPGTGLGRFIP